MTDIVSEGEGRLAPDSEQELYRVAQEALNNVLKHAHAAKVSLRLQVTDDHATMDVADDGIGFEPSHEDTHGFGLQGMRERMERIGGTLRIESSPGSGTHIRVEVPR